MGVSPVTTTPVQRLDAVSAAVGRRVYAKREDLTAPDFGGNKARKLAPLLDEAVRGGITDLLTICALGSHQFAALGVYAVPLGLGVHAVVVPTPHLPRVEELARFGVHHGVTPVLAHSEADALRRLWATRRALKKQGRRPLIVPPGATDVGGRATRAYLAAGREALAQVDALEGEVDAIAEHVCVLGSGGTCAGIWAAALEHAAQGYAPARVRGVQIFPTPAVGRPTLYALACLALGRTIAPRAPLVLDARSEGRGYGHPSAEGAQAATLFAQDGIDLDPVYTAKAGAALLRAADEGTLRDPVLFWHTTPGLRLEQVDLGPPLPDAVRALLLSG